MLPPPVSYFPPPNVQYPPNYASHVMTQPQRPFQSFNYASGQLPYPQPPNSNMSSNVLFHTLFIQKSESSSGNDNGRSGSRTRPYSKKIKIVGSCW